MSAPIVTPLTYGDALALMAAVCPVARAVVCPPHDANACDFCSPAAKVAMAVDSASREQAWADKGGPELLAALKKAQESLADVTAQAGLCANHIGTARQAEWLRNEVRAVARDGHAAINAAIATAEGRA